MVVISGHVILPGLGDRCHLCKIYQVGGFAAPVPCTNVINLRFEMRVDNRETIMRDLHPIAQQRFRKLADYLHRAYQEGRTQSYFAPFQGLRTPLQQEELFRQRPPVTHVGAWHSAHNYGMAVDFVAVDASGNWSWSEKHQWNFLRAAAMQHGLKNHLDWDRAHVEAPEWAELFLKVKQLETTTQALTMPNPFSA